MNPKVDLFLDKAQKWSSEMSLLRNIVLDCNLVEGFKWMHPCYTLNNSNVVLIHNFKDYCALLFHKGALLKDPDNILIQQTENVQAARQLRFTDSQQIIDLEPTIKAYIYEAIKVEKAGLKIEYKPTKEYEVPEELQSILDESSELKEAFEALTPGRQRGYLLHFSQPKQSKTRTARIEKCIPKIFAGKGFNDR